MDTVQRIYLQKYLDEVDVLALAILSVMTSMDDSQGPMVDDTTILLNLLRSRLKLAIEATIC